MQINYIANKMSPGLIQSREQYFSVIYNRPPSLFP